MIPKCTPRWSTILLCLVLSIFFTNGVGQSPPPKSSKDSVPEQDPQLKLRPPLVPGAEDGNPQRIHLDVVVTDSSGKSVPELTQQDFSILDNGKQASIASFAAFKGQGDSAYPSVEVIFLIDTVNSGLLDVDLTREAIEKILRRNGGHLEHPTSVFWFTDAGVRVMLKPSTDGNALADLVHRVAPTIHTIHSAAGSEGLLERLQLSVRTLSLIAANESKKPGRKLLVWTGPGWPTLSAEPVLYNARGHHLNFDSIVSLSTSLRQARMELCSPAAGSGFFSGNFMKGVKTAHDASSGNLGLQVLAIQSGGRTLDPGNGSHIGDLISSCVMDAGPYYTLSFDPPKAEQADEYHQLTVKVDKPGLKVRTNSGYYIQP